MVGAGVAQSIVSAYGLDDRAIGARSPEEATRFFLYPVSAQPPVQWVPGTFLGAKARPESDADHSPPSRPRSRMSRSYTLLPPNASEACSGTALRTCKNKYVLPFSFVCLALERTFLSHAL
jgi:hypothetical protein